MPVPAAHNISRLGELVLKAIATDTELVDALVLKGGNALQLIYGVASRASKDLDFSVEDKLVDPARFAQRLKSVLEGSFNLAGYEFLDFQFGERPQEPKPDHPPTWGGYQAQFKAVSRSVLERALEVEARRLRKKEAAGHVVERSKLDEKARREDVARRNAGPVIKVDISHHEFTQGKQPAKLDDDLIVYVYTLPMIVAEKLRAICQQMPEYRQRASATRRPRDFYDIHACATLRNVHLREHVPLIRSMFAAKDVPLELLENFESQRAYHALDWQKVRDAVVAVEELQPFDFYFDFVLAEVQAVLKALRDV